MLPVNCVKARPGAWLSFMMVTVMMTVVLLVEAPVAEATAGSRYDRTIRALQAAEPEWQADFAGIALWQLTGAYRAEADLARQDIALVQKNRHWSSSVDQYAGRLSVYQRRVEEGARIDFVLSPVTEAVLQVEGEPVMLAHPRPGQQAAFEQSVLEQFCQLRDCGSLTGLAALADRQGVAGLADGVVTVVGDQPLPETDRASAARLTLKPGWEFTTEGPVCTYAGVRLRFQQGDNPGAVRKLCLDLFAEIAVLGDGLRQQQQYGVVVEWAALEFSQTAVDGDSSMLKLNRSGDMLRLRAPLLKANAALLRSLTPWLESHLAEQQTTLDLQAGTYGWRGAALDRFR